MARRKNDAPHSDFSFDAVAVVETNEMPSRAPRTEKPNPLLPHVTKSLETGTALALPNIPQDAVKDAQNYLRRAAIKLACGIEIRPADNGDGTMNLHFRAKHEKRSRSYTVADVRAWAEEMGYGESDLYPRVSREVSDAYRVAHGHAKPKNGE